MPTDIHVLHDKTRLQIYPDSRYIRSEMPSKPHFSNCF